MSEANRVASSGYHQVIDWWNAQADEYNQWDTLGEDEKIENAFYLSAQKCIEVGKEGEGLAGEVWCEDCARAIRAMISDNAPLCRLSAAADGYPTTEMED